MNLLKRSHHKMRDMSAPSKKIGIVVLVVFIAFGIAAYQKQRLVSVLSPGDMINASFTRQYRLEPYQSTVKLAGVRVGEVTGVEKGTGGGADVTMRLDKGTLEKLGGEPTAAIRPTLVVGGVYYVELSPGGRGGIFNGRIPVDRTTVPVELDGVLSAINPSAQKGLQGMLHHFDDTLRQGGRDAIRNFLHQTPPALRPTSEVLTAVRGTDPANDLPRLVSGLEGFSAVFNRKEGQFADIIDTLNTATGSLNAERKPLTDFFGTMPETFRNTRVGLVDLQGSLDRLTDTAPRFRDSAQELDPLLKRLGPVLHDARPVVSNLNDVLDDAEPLLHRLRPVADKGTDMFEDIRGPVLDRVNGPVKNAVLNDWHGSGVYANGGNDHEMYKEIAYLVEVFDETWMNHDQNGALGRLAAGEEGSAATGGSQFPRTFEEMLESAGGHKPNGPQDFDQRDKGLSAIENRKPVNEGTPRVPAPGPVPGNTSNPLMLPMQGGSK